jgi:hypothetical protein
MLINDSAFRVITMNHVFSREAQKRHSVALTAIQEL